MGKNQPWRDLGGEHSRQWAQAGECSSGGQGLVRGEIRRFGGARVPSKAEQEGEDLRGSWARA